MMTRKLIRGQGSREVVRLATAVEGSHGDRHLLRQGDAAAAADRRSNGILGRRSTRSRRKARPGSYDGLSAAACEALRADKARARAIILLSDGEDTDSQLELAAAMARPSKPASRSTPSESARGSRPMSCNRIAAIRPRPVLRRAEGTTWTGVFRLLQASSRASTRPGGPRTTTRAERHDGRGSDAAGGRRARRRSRRISAT